MAFLNNCNKDSSSAFCVCTDYYGNVLPEYKHFDSVQQTYSCCNILDVVEAVPGDKSGDWVSQFVRNSFGNTGCHDIVPQTDSEFKTKLPLLYYQGLLNASIYEKFTSTPTINNKQISCTAGIPYIVKIPNYSNSDISYKLFCGSETISDLENIKLIGTNTDADYSINYLYDTTDSDCKTRECTLQYDYEKYPEYSIGNQVYKSKGSISSSSPLLKGWFWAILLIICIILGILLYFLYYAGMERYFRESVSYLNNLFSGLGDVAKEHSEKVKQSHLHIST